MLKKRLIVIGFTILLLSSALVFQLQGWECWVCVEDNCEQTLEFEWGQSNCGEDHYPNGTVKCGTSGDHCLWYI